MYMAYALVAISLNAEGDAAKNNREAISRVTVKKATIIVFVPLHCNLTYQRHL